MTQEVITKNIPFLFSLDEIYQNNTSLVAHGGIDSTWKEQAPLHADLLFMCLDYLVQEVKCNKTGKLSGYCVNGQKHGEWKEWDTDGKLFTYENYIHGRLHGERKWWNEKGVLFMHENYMHGILHGERKCWRADGQLRWSIHYKHGVLHGDNKEWCETIDIHEVYENGVLHGERRCWYKNGRPQSTGTYNHGIKHGLFKQYSEDGKTTLETNYVNGKKQQKWNL